jgi:hypothetical protein
VPDFWDQAQGDGCGFTSRATVARELLSNITDSKPVAEPQDAGALKKEFMQRVAG